MIIENNNRKIAIFMGARSHRNSDTNKMEVLVDIPNPFGGKMFLFTRSLRYHESWDWLLQVVSKISGIEGPMAAQTLLAVQASILDIKTAWLAVVAFIDWYINIQKEGECIVGEMVINLLNGKEYLFEEGLAQQLHFPKRLV